MAAAAQANTLIQRLLHCISIQTHLMLLLLEEIRRRDKSLAQVHSIKELCLTVGFR